jgi:hypothetical protein
LVHLAFLAAVVALAHHPVLFLGLFLFFLAGLAVLGGMQQWWLQPLVSGLAPTALFFGALGLTAITDNAALTYLGSLIEGLSDSSKYMLVPTAVAAVFFLLL